MRIRWKRLLVAPFVFLAAIIILIEDWLWDDLARIAAAIGRLPIFRQIEALIVRLPPYASLAVFAAPTLLLIPVKLTALWLIAHGQHALGLLSIVMAKFVGTALVARLFILTRPNLLRIGWFARFYERFTDFKTRIYTTIKTTGVYQLVHQQHLRWKALIKEWGHNRKPGFWKRRWEGARRLSRRWRQSEE
jgi:hypothetical protein